MTALPTVHPHRMNLSDREKALVLALRADPDQERHIVDYGSEITVRHPISERLGHGNDLFGCPALADATNTIILDDLPPGRYRLSDDTVGDLERI